ncbi:MAG: hypothetical protein ACHQ1D_02580 [Nitrososphaerales archaeon]
MNNATKLTVMTILAVGILISSFMVSNTNPAFAKKNKQCDKTGTFCQTTAKNIKNSSPSGENGKDGTNGITITGKQGINESNIVEEDTQLDNSTTIASNASASTSAMDNSGAAIHCIIKWFKG